MFSAYLASTLGQEFVPKSIGIINKGKVYLTESKEWLSVNEFWNKICLCIKKIDGECADGGFISKETLRDELYPVKRNIQKRSIFGNYLVVEY